MGYKKLIEDIDQNIHRLHFKYNFMKLKDLDMHPGQLTLLVSLLKKTNSTQSDLAKEHDVSSATIGMSVKRLEKTGLIIKKLDSNDLRTSRLELTEKGLKYAVLAEKTIQEINDIKLDGFSQAEMEQYHSFLTRIKNNLEKHILR